MLEQNNCKILSIDCSTELCSVSVAIETEMFCKEQYASNEHTKLILPMIEDVLAEARIAKNELDAVAFGKGPGSFTGVRVAAAVTEGIAFGLGIKIFGISTLHALAVATLAATEYDAILATLDARMGEIYWALFRKDGAGVLQLIIAEQVSKFAEIMHYISGYCIQHNYPLENIIAAGTGVSSYREQFAATGINIADLSYPSARYIGALAKQDLQSVMPKYVLSSAIPMYVRDNVVAKGGTQ